MPNRSIIKTEAAPAAIGTYSQAVQAGNTIYLSGQIPLDPETMALVNETFEAEVHQVFKNLRAVLNAAGGDLSNLVKLNIFMTDLSNFTTVNEIMAEYFHEPYPARAAIEVSGLPKGAAIEADGIAIV
ncbi:MAG: RidA family protein [Gammaproteobacteria bacterium]|nr:RidA family protein [Gammaproteobacteria bacterium]